MNHSSQSNYFSFSNNTLSQLLPKISEMIFIKCGTIANYEDLIMDCTELHGSGHELCALSFNKHDLMNVELYRANPLPETIFDYIWNLGSTLEEEELKYIEIILQNLQFEWESESEQPVAPEDMKFLFWLVSKSQTFVLEVLGSKSVATLRDIRRFQKLAKWVFSNTQDLGEQQDCSQFLLKYKCIILALSICNSVSFTTQELRNQYHLLIADLLTEYTTRNYYFYTGKPGSSKSLAMSLIKANFQDKNSEDSVFKLSPETAMEILKSEEGTTVIEDDFSAVTRAASNFTEPVLESKVQNVFSVPAGANNSPDEASSVLALDNTLPTPFSLLDWLHKLMDPVVEMQKNYCRRIFEKGKVYTKYVLDEAISLFASLGVIAEPCFSFVENNGFMMVKSMILFMVGASFALTLLYPFLVFGSTEDTEMKTITKQALHDYIKQLEQNNLQETTVHDLMKGTVALHLPAIFYLQFWINLPWNCFSWTSSAFQHWFMWLTAVISVCYIYLIGPVIALFNIFGIYELIRENQERKKREADHKNKSIPETVILGWNFFKRVYDGNQLTGIEFTIPTEACFYFEDILRYDSALLEKVTNKVRDCTTLPADPLCPDYMVTLDNVKDQFDLSRTLHNVVSSSHLKFAEKARKLKADQSNPEEDPIYVITCEKNPKIPVQSTRIWLILPSELKNLKNYRKEIAERTFFILPEDKQNWWTRLDALLQWADAEFDESGNRVKRKYISNIICTY
jgi:hypothetical protein